MYLSINQLVEKGLWVFRGHFVRALWAFRCLQSVGTLQYVFCFNLVDDLGWRSLFHQS